MVDTKVWDPWISECAKWGEMAVEHLWSDDASHLLSLFVQTTNVSTWYKRQTSLNVSVGHGVNTP